MMALLEAPPDAVSDETAYGSNKDTQWHCGWNSPSATSDTYACTYFGTSNCASSEAHSCPNGLVAPAWIWMCVIHCATAWLMVGRLIENGWQHTRFFQSSYVDKVLRPCLAAFARADTYH